MLRIHFLNVGHGDCTVIKHPSGRLTMIDINNSQDYDGDSLREYMEQRFAGQLGAPRMLSELLAKGDAQAELTDPIAFLKTTYPGESLFRFVLTHPDLDHMRGLSRLHSVIGFANFWDVQHTKPTPSFRSDADRDDWNFYQRLRGGAVGLQPKNYHRGMAHFAYAREEDGSVGGDNIEILSPTPELVASCNAAAKSNDVSMVLRVTHAGRSVILPGDAEEEAWEGMLAHYGRTLQSDFLKASHHGRDSGYHLDSLQAIDPRHVVVSVGRKPPTDASRKYAAQCDDVNSTRYYGDIELRITDDGSYQWFVQRNAGT